MENAPVYRCPCSDCQQARNNPTKCLHTQINLLLSTLDERQRRLYVGLESKKLGHGGDHQLSVITGMSVPTIARGRKELDQEVRSARIRRPGAGRKPIEKKLPKS
jgi:hypothetical protein